MPLVAAAMILGSVACAPPDGGTRTTAPVSSDTGGASTLTLGSMFWVVPDESHAPQHHSTIAISSDGARIAVAWDVTAQPPTAHVRTYDASGIAEGPASLLATCTEDYPCRPDIVWSSDAWWVAWADDSGVQAVHLDTTLVEDPVVLGVPTAGQSLEAPDLTPLTDGGVGVVWFGSHRFDGHSDSVYDLRVLGPDGVPASPLRLDAPDAGASPPDIAPLPDGMTVVWVNRGNTDLGIQSTMLTGDFDPHGLERHREVLQSSEHDLTRPMIAIEDGDRAIVWREDRPRRVSWLQLLPSGEPSLPPILIDSGHADTPVVALAGGVAWVAWMTDPGPSADATVHLRGWFVHSGEPATPRLTPLGGGGAEARPGIAVHDDGERVRMWISLRQEPPALGDPGRIAIVSAEWH